jgi:hypothetical protein
MEGGMRLWRNLACGAIGASALLAASPSTPSAAPCDEYNPASPARSVVVALTPTDFVDEERDEMRSFVETGSLGPVEVSIVSAVPRGIVHGFVAVPEVSRFSPYYGEALKGIAVGVTVEPGRRPVRVLVKVRQVCAKFFRNSFLYY